MSDEDHYRRLSDPRELQALAHPVRMGIVELLSMVGPMTATELAERLDETPANCSWHLRKLAAHQFVEEAPAGPGRRRPWKMTQLGTTFSDEDASPAAVRAGDELTRLIAERRVERLHESRARSRTEPDPAWRTAGFVGDHASWLTAEELVELNEEALGILARYEKRLSDPSLRPQGSRLVEFVYWGIPSPIDARPTSEEEHDDA